MTDDLQVARKRLHEIAHGLAPNATTRGEQTTAAVKVVLDALDEKEKEAAALREQLRAYGHSPEEYTSEGHAAAHRCEYDSGHILHGMPSLCAPCRVELEKVKEAAEERLAGTQAENKRIYDRLDELAPQVGLLRQRLAELEKAAYVIRAWTGVTRTLVARCAPDDYDDYAKADDALAAALLPPPEIPRAERAE